MRFARLQRPLLPALLGLGLLLSLFGCGTFGRAPAPPLPVAFERAQDLVDDPRFVVRDRLDLAGAERRDGIKGTSFSHRSQRYHVYPFTTYGESRVEVEIRVRDKRFEDRAGLWILGPRQSDGSWASVSSARGEHAAVSVDAQGLGEYIAIVGPTTPGGFLPRYPGVEAQLEAETEEGFDEEAALFEPAPDDQVFLSFAGEYDPESEPLAGRRYRVLQPVTGLDRVDALPDKPFDLVYAEECVDPACTTRREEVVAFAPRSWTRYQLFAPQDAKDLDDSRLGALNDPQHGFFTVFTKTSPHRPESTYQILEAIGADGGVNFADPAILRVVPLAHGDCEIDVVEGPNCDHEGGACHVPVCLESDVPPPIDLPILSFRATSLDIDETSLYDIEAKCEGDCSPSAEPTRYPVYLAHGFNSSKEVWDDVTTRVVESDQRWNSWIAAQSVPPFEPVWLRAEQLRRNLTMYLRGLETLGTKPPEGESIQRINIIAHSMGGLDCRVLVGDPKYNDPMCHLKQECLTADGVPESCCASDADGNAIPWRARIASVTTLSTPHRGSSFADLGVNLLKNQSVDWAFRKAAHYVLGLDSEEEQQHLRDTLYTLSNQFSEETMTPDYPPIQPARVYPYACMTKLGGCTLPPNAEVSLEEGTLPPPNETTTFFGWASEACVTGSCGSIVDPGLALSYGIVKKREGAGDGVVATRSAEFGIYMGVRANDHFHWNRLSFAGIVDFAANAFGVRREPVDRFYTHWLGTLSRSGY